MATTVGPEEMFRIVAVCYVYDPATYEFLILRRKLDHAEFPGLWTAPGGGLSREDYVDLPQVAGRAWPNVLEIVGKRETKEEAGVEITDMRMLGNLAFARRDGIHVLCVKFLATLASPRSAVKIEKANFIDHRWVGPSDIPRFEFVGEMGEDMLAYGEMLRARGQLCG